MQVLDEVLEMCDYGICFINSDNARAPWIQFEAGALSKISNNAKVVVILLDNNVDSLDGNPLSQFQYVLFDKIQIKSGVFEKIIKTFKLEDSKDIFINRFEINWEKFYEKSTKISNDSKTDRQNDEDILNDKEELDTIKKMLVDVLNLQKTELNQTVKDSMGLLNELKKLLKIMNPEDFSRMQVHYKIDRYEKTFQQIIYEIEEVLDSLDNDDIKDNVLIIDRIKEKLDNIIGKAVSSIND